MNIRVSLEIYLRAVVKSIDIFFFVRWSPRAFLYESPGCSLLWSSDATQYVIIHKRKNGFKRNEMTNMGIGASNQNLITSLHSRTILTSSDYSKSGEHLWNFQKLLLLIITNKIY